MLDDVIAQRDESMWRRAMTALGRLALCVCGMQLLMCYVVIRLGSDRRPEVITELRKGLGPRVEAAVMNYVEFWEEQGRLQGQRSLLMKQLTRLFGKLPEHVTRRVEVADTEEIGVLADRVLSAKSLAEVLGEA